MKKTEKKIKERGTGVHVSAEGGLAASKIDCTNNSCPQKDKRAGVGIGSQSWPGLLKHEEKAGRNPGLDRPHRTAASDRAALEESNACCRRAAGQPLPANSCTLWDGVPGSRAAAGGSYGIWGREGYNDLRAVGHMLIIIVEQKPRKIKWNLRGENFN